MLCSVFVRFFTFALYYSVAQKWRICKQKWRVSSVVPPWRGERGVGSRARDRQPGGALRRGAVERTPTPGEDAAGRRATAGAVARTPQRARGQGRHRRRRTIAHPDARMRSSSAGGRTPGRSGSPLDSGAALAVGHIRRGGSAVHVGSRTFGGRVMSTGRAVSGAPRPARAAHLCVP